MRLKIINFLKKHPFWLNIIWIIARFLLKTYGFFIPIQQKTILFTSFGGRRFDDSPKAIYDEICQRSYFDNWRLVWAFVEPENFRLERGEKIKIDTITFFRALLYSHVWVSNSGMDRGIGLKRKGIISVETWHGTPIKKIGGEENQNAIGGKNIKLNKKIDTMTIRCAQSEFDRKIFQRVFHADKDAFLLSDLPRNDALLKYSVDECRKIRDKLGIKERKKVILYAPTYREYLVDTYNSNRVFLPIDFSKWEERLGSEYIILLRMHYAVSAKFKWQEKHFVKDVSDYPVLNDLYAISSILISDYSSAFFDYSILERPMLCFAYDLEEYEMKRGLYVKLEKIMPCSIDLDEDTLIKHILEIENEKKEEIKASIIAFRKKYVPNPGHASQVVVDEIERRLRLI